MGSSGSKKDKNNNSKSKGIHFSDSTIHLDGHDVDDEVLKSRNKQQLIKRNGEYYFDLRVAQKKLSVSRSILQSLYDSYSTTRGSCPCCRQTDMDMLVREALDEYGRKVEGFDPDRLDLDDEKLQLVSPLQRLVERSRRMSVIGHQRTEEIVKLTDMNVNELQSELMRTITKIDGATKEWEEEQKRFKKLERSFERLHNTNFFSKYGALKQMISMATEDCLKDY